MREILAPFPGCISFDLAIQGRRSRVAPGYALKPLRGKSDTLLGTSLSTPLTLVTLAPNVNDDWSFCLRLTDDEGGPGLAGVK